MFAVGPQPDDISLIRDNVDQLVSAIKAGQYRVRLSDFGADLDRKTEVTLRPEIKRNNGMRNIG
jgi:hypothetical protein